MKQLLHSLEQILQQLRDPFIVFITTLGLFLAPIAELIIAAILLSLLDFLTAIIAASKKNIPITSEKMGQTFPKIILYGSAIILMHYLDMFLVHQVKLGFIDHLLRIFMEDKSIELLNHVKLTSAISFLIIVREMKSIDENWKIFFGWSFYATIKDYIISPIIKIKNAITNKKIDSSDGGSN